MKIYGNSGPRHGVLRVMGSNRGEDTDKKEREVDVEKFFSINH